MNNIFYSSGNQLLFPAFQRYFYFVFAEQISGAFDYTYTTLTIDILFIDEDEQNLQIIFDLVKTTELKKIIVFGCNPAIKCSNYLNLMDLENLKNTLHSILTTEAIQPDFSASIYISAVREKLRLFFEGHGETSLLASLNEVYYSLNNGIKLYLSAQYEIEDLIRDFIKPGLASWDNFKIRLNKYSDYLVLSGFQNMLTEIEMIINKSEPFIAKIESFLEAGKLPVDESELAAHMDYFKRISYIFYTMSIKIQ